jgi:hypothetical protein
MLEQGNIKIPEIDFTGWGNPEAIEVYYYEDQETKNKKSSGFAIVYSIEKEELLTSEFIKKIEGITRLIDNDLEIIYRNLECTGIEKDENYITIGFSAIDSLTYESCKNRL